MIKVSSATPKNVGEGIAIVGIMVAVGLTKNYWLLFFSIIPWLTWEFQENKSQKKS